MLAEAQGARVAIGDIESSLAEQTAGELGGGTIGLPLDVTDRESFARFLDEVETQLGPLDVLINNAGIMPIGSFVEESDATALRMIDINLVGLIYGSKLALERFLPRMVAVSAMATPATGGLAGRPAVDRGDGLYLAGDWVGGEGWLVDAALASGAAAAAAALRSRTAAPA